MAKITDNAALVVITKNKGVMMYLRKLSVFTLLLSASSLAAAEIEPILTIGLEGGGDELVSTTETDLNAGGGITVGAGFSVSQPGSSLSFRTVLNYLFDTVEFTNPDGDASFDALPVNLGVFHTSNRHELGAGLSYHLNPSYEISSSSPFINGTVDFDNASGIFLEYHYIFSQAETAAFTTDTYFGVRVTSIDYEVGGTTLDAGSVGLFLGSKF